MMMSAISVKQPWASCILPMEWMYADRPDLPLPKGVENRTVWRYKHRGPTLIHASNTYDVNGPTFRNGAAALPSGCILGVADLDGVITASCDDDYWYNDGCVGLLLTNKRRFLRPIPWKGALGVWILFVTPELEAQIETAVVV